MFDTAESQIMDQLGDLDHEFPGCVFLALHSQQHKTVHSSLATSRQPLRRDFKVRVPYFFIEIGTQHFLLSLTPPKRI